MQCRVRLAVWRVVQVRYDFIVYILRETLNLHLRQRGMRKVTTGKITKYLGNEIVTDSTLMRSILEESDYFDNVALGRGVKCQIAARRAAVWMRMLPSEAVLWCLF